jgi:hypothetical protein
MAEKTCPKCPNAPAMNASAVLGIIPAKLEETLSAEIINDKCGLTVRAYECPHCHLIELYREG